MLRRKPHTAMDGTGTYTAETLAEILGLHKQAVYRQARKGNIPGCRRAGKRVFFSKQVIDHWLETGENLDNLNGQGGN